MSEDGLTYKISGLSEMQRELEGLNEKIQKRCARRCVRAGAKVTLEAILARVPVLSGFLRDHFKITTHVDRSDPTSAWAHVGPTTERYPAHVVRKLKKLLGDAMPYAPKTASLVLRFLEFGTSHATGKHPMSVGFETSKDAALQAMLAQLQADIQDAIQE